MSTLDEWQARNAEYLSVALAWLRLKLQSGVRRAHAAAEPPGEVEAVDAVRRRLDELQVGEFEPALPELARRLGLSEFERDLLLLCVAMELDTRTATLCAGAQDEPRPYPTFALALSMFDGAAWEALSPDRPLRYWRLLEVSQSTSQPLTASALRADERIVNYVKGLNRLDERLAPLMSPVPAATLDSLPGSQRVAARKVIADLQATHKLVAPVVLVGRDPDSRRQLAAAVAGAAGLQVCRLPHDLLPSHPGDLESMTRLWHRETLLLPLALYVDAQDVNRADNPGTDSPLTRLTRFVTRCGGLVFVGTREPLHSVLGSHISVEVEKPTPAEQQSAWVTALGAESASIAPRLAGQFNLNRQDIAGIVVRARKEDEALPLSVRVWRACRTRTRPTLDRLAVRIDAKATWDHIVLPKVEAGLLRQVAAQVDARTRVYDEWGFRSRMNRGLGISALFAGESGTGKSMAAEVLANALELDLYCIDLSAVVSKYIGETEKNLRQVFDEAEEGGAILLFDEADALFGKRSDVKDSHDRYANIEINYLLQRMEAYRGLAILATNMKSALDTAFMRRLRFIIKFPFPQTAERRRMWERAFPAGTPLGVLDFERLGRLGVTGGTIHNIALNAAFAAAHAGTPVTMTTILEAARIEFRKTDRPINELDFKYADGAEARA